MTHRRKRCEHCKTQYSYQASGEGCFHPLNNDRYCPDCMAIINEALKDVPEKFHREWLPPFKGFEHVALSIEEFDEAYKKNWDDVALHTYPVEFGCPDVEIRDVAIKGVEYRKYTDKITHDVVIMARFEVNQEDKVTDTW